MAPESVGEQAGEHSLRQQTAFWSSPRASDGEKGSPNQSFGAGGEPLASQVTMWATPRASEGNEDFAQIDRSTTGIALPAQAALWSTPSVADVEGGRTSRSGDRQDEVMLNGQAAQAAAAIETWKSPRVSERGAYTRDKGDPSLERLTLDGQASRLSPQVPATSPDGSTSSPSTRRLNPRFVGWLMNWPAGWTRFACSEMELTLWSERYRSVLWSIDYRSGTAAQPDFFA